MCQLVSKRQLVLVDDQGRRLSNTVGRGELGRQLDSTKHLAFAARPSGTYLAYICPMRPWSFLHLSPHYFGRRIPEGRHLDLVCPQTELLKALPQLRLPPQQQQQRFALHLLLVQRELQRLQLPLPRPQLLPLQPLLLSL
jgi:hypothetical protein